MLPNSLPASFFKVLLLPQKINRFQLPLPHPGYYESKLLLQLRPEVKRFTTGNRNTAYMQMM